MATSSTKSNGGINWKWIFSLIAWCAVVAIALSILISYVFKDLAAAFDTIAAFLAYFVVAFYSFYFAWHHAGKKRLIYTVIWAVAVTLIIIFKILVLVR